MTAARNFRLLRSPARHNGVVGIVGDDVHAFAYPWGITVRFRRGDDWQHFTVKVEAERLAVRRRLLLKAESWRTEDGTTSRVRFSKRYVALKVLA